MVLGDKIYCKAGKGLVSKTRKVNIRQMARGEPLEMTICQQCPDFSSMGDSIPKNERGWIKTEKI